MPIIYENLSDEELTNCAKAKLGEALRPIEAIGREAVIEELKYYDAVCEFLDQYGRLPLSDQDLRLFQSFKEKHGIKI